MPKLLLATHNQAKIDELSKFIQEQTDQLNLTTLAEQGITQEPDEPGATIIQNATLKAHWYGSQTSLPCLADDGGFEIDALNGEPGVKSNRWLGYKASDQELIDYTLERMKDVPEDQRQAALVLCLCYYNPKSGKTATATSLVTGIVLTRAVPEYPPGFPFRAIFQPDTDRPVDHRRDALADLLPKISADLVQ